jgi:hypothetical protein
MADDMEKPLTATELRANVYRILDGVIETGRSRTIIRSGNRLVITLERDRRLKLEDLPERRATDCSPDELVETSWEHEWKP